jgi:hypothetical protein
MAPKVLNIEPAFVPAAAGNLLNCKITSLAGPVGYTQTQPYIVLRHIRLTNNDSSPHAVTLYKGATGASVAGTEFAFAGFSIPGNSWVDWYGKARFDSADFLTGVCDTASKVTFNAEGEIELS